MIQCNISILALDDEGVTELVDTFLLPAVPRVGEWIEVSRASSKWQHNQRGHTRRRVVAVSYRANDTAEMAEVNVYLEELDLRGTEERIEHYRGLLSHAALMDIPPHHMPPALHHIYHCLADFPVYNFAEDL